MARDKLHEGWCQASVRLTLPGQRSAVVIAHIAVILNNDLHRERIAIFHDVFESLLISCDDENPPAMMESMNRDSGVPLPQPPGLQTSIPSTGGKLPNHARATSPTRLADSQKLQPDTTSDKATAAFIRRTLCSHNTLLGNGEKGRSTPRPIEDVLPPLTSSNAVDLQLYGIISVIIREFVQTWYSKITPDQVFVNEVIQIIAHCTRGLEQRLRKVDLESLLLDEIPELLQSHLSCRWFRSLDYCMKCV